MYKRQENVVYIPTTIDTNYHKNEVEKDTENQLTIGWTGTHTTVKYLHQIESVLAKIQQQVGFKFHVISNQDPNFKQLDYIYFKWRRRSEIEDLAKIDIGLMPLLDNDWSRGKCGFKALQYMAMEIPSIISPVGVNKKIIKEGVNGFLAKNETDWEKRIVELLNSKELRSKIGSNGIETVKKTYSVESCLLYTSPSPRDA